MLKCFDSYLSNKTIILASSSPRRKDILSKMVNNMQFGSDIFCFYKTCMYLKFLGVLI